MVWNENIIFYGFSLCWTCCRDTFLSDYDFSPASAGRPYDAPKTSSSVDNSRATGTTSAVTVTWCL